MGHPAVFRFSRLRLWLKLGSSVVCGAQPNTAQLSFRHIWRLAQLEKSECTPIPPSLLVIYLVCSMLSLPCMVAILGAFSISSLTRHGRPHPRHGVVFRLQKIVFFSIRLQTNVFLVFVSSCITFVLLILYGWFYMYFCNNLISS